MIVVVAARLGEFGEIPTADQLERRFVGISRRTAEYLACVLRVGRSVSSKETADAGRAGDALWRRLSPCERSASDTVQRMISEGALACS